MYRGNSSRCAPRMGRELKTYSLRGWVRRVKKEEDGDWHVELTGARTGDVTNCVIVEIPNPDDGSQYTIVRHQFNALIDAAGASIASNGDVTPFVP